MSRIHFDRLHSVEVEGENFLIRTLDPRGLSYEWTIPINVATLLVLAIESASKALPDNLTSGQMLQPLGFQAIVTENMMPGLQIAISDTLALTLILPGNALAGLKTAIAQLESSTPRGPIQ